jgi:CHASE3 domain sensor protein
MVPGAVTMKANAAVAFILLGAAILTTTYIAGTSAGSASGHAAGGRVAGLLTALAGAIGLITVFEYGWNWDPGFDQWLFTEPANAVGTSMPGRMAPETATCFVVLAAAVGLLGTSRTSGARLVAAAAGGVCVAILAGAALVSHITPTLGARGWWGQTVMAVPTAATFAVLGVTITRAALGGLNRFWFLSRTTTAGFAGGLALLLLVHLTLSRSQTQAAALHRDLQWHEQVAAGYIRILAGVARIQNHTRGYVLTADLRFVDAYHRADAACRFDLAQQGRLVGLTREAQWPALADKAALVLRWFQSVINAPLEREDDLLRRQQVLHGENLMDDFRRSIEQLEESEEAARRDPRARATQVVDGETGFDAWIAALLRVSQ